MFTKQNKTVLWDEVATNGRKRYFNIDENASTEQIYALLNDVESPDEDYIDNLISQRRKKRTTTNKKVKVTKQEYFHLMPEIEPNLNETVSPK